MKKYSNICPNCGAENPIGANFCKVCGRSLNGENRGAGDDWTEEGIWESGSEEQGENLDSGTDEENSFEEDQPQDSYDEGQPDHWDSAWESGREELNAGADSVDDWLQENPRGDHEEESSDYEQQAAQDAGRNQTYASNGDVMQNRAAAGFAKASQVLGILGIAFWFVPFLCLGLGIAGLLLAAVAKAKGNRSRIRREGMAYSLTAVIIGIIFIIVLIATGIGGVYEGISGRSEESEEEAGGETAEEEESETAEETEEGGGGKESAQEEKESVEGAEDEAASAFDIDFESITAVDNESCSIVVTDLEPKSWGYTVTIQLENKTEDQILEFNMESSVNGLYNDDSEGWFSEDVIAGITVVESVQIDTTEFLSEYGIEDPAQIGLDEITDIGLIFDVYDEEDYQDVAEETVHIYPLGAENAEVFEREPADTDLLLIDNDFVTVTAVGSTYESEGGVFQVNLFIENKTEEELSFWIRECAVNGESCSGYLWPGDIPAGTCMYTGIEWSESRLDELEISDPESQIESVDIVLGMNNIGSDNFVSVDEDFSFDPRVLE